VDFVYTRCVTLCLALGSVFQQLQAQVLAQGLQDRVGLLSISFDPANDGPEALAAYARRMRMQPAVWSLVSLADAADRRRLLDSFGIMVVPAPLGEFEHNAALHLVTPDGQLVRILGLEQGAQALALAQAWHTATADADRPATTKAASTAWAAGALPTR
jgi:protein SCO1/2